MQGRPLWLPDRSSDRMKITCICLIRQSDSHKDNPCCDGKTGFAIADTI